MNIFTVITPRILEKFNTLKIYLKKPANLLRAGIILSVFLALIIFIFECTYVIAQIFDTPFYILNFIFSVIFVLTFFSGAIISINEFFVSNDLNIFLTSPIKKLHFYVGKILLSLFSATWMPCSLIIPSLLALGLYYKQGILYYLLLPFLILPILTIPILIGNIFVFIFSKLIPIKVFKEILFFLYSIMFVLIGILIKKLFAIKMSTTVSSPSNIFPFNWIANIMSNMLLNKEFLFDNLINLYTLFTVLFFISLYLFSKNYFKILNALSSYSSQKIIVIKNLGKLLKILTCFLDRIQQEFIFKEFKTFFRNIGQTSQIFLLLGIVFLYFSNLNFLTRFSHEFSANDAIIPIISFSLCAFILVAFCTRFIFPSLSLEAKAYDIFLKSPQKLEVIFHAKKNFWFAFLSLLSTIIFVSTAFVLNFSPSSVVLCFVFGLICSYGLTSVTFFVGCYFLKLNWKNPYELCASVGSLCSMFLSIFYIFSLFFASYIGYYTFYLSYISHNVRIMIVVIGILVANIVFSKILTRLTIRKLKEKILL